MTRMVDYQIELNTPVTVTPQQVADVLHRQMYGPEAKPHGVFHSCPCYNLALFYLGLRDSHGLYWPDGKGGNQWDKTT